MRYLSAIFSKGKREREGDRDGESEHGRMSCILGNIACLLFSYSE